MNEQYYVFNGDEMPQDIINKNNFELYPNCSFLVQSDCTGHFSILGRISDLIFLEKIVDECVADIYYQVTPNSLNQVKTVAISNFK